MDKELKQLKRIGEEMRLSSEEKHSMRGFLMTDMGVQHEGKFLSPLFMRPMVVVLSVLIILAGSSYLASNTLPGDFLYPVKTSINERVEGTLVFSEDDKILWELEKMERRIVEEETLLLATDLENI
jgi:hypothetical protein